MDETFYIVLYIEWIEYKPQITKTELSVIYCINNMYTEYVQLKMFCKKCYF